MMGRSERSSAPIRIGSIRIGSFVGIPILFGCLFSTGCGSGGALEPELGDYERLLMDSGWAAEAEEGTEAFNNVFVDGATLHEDRSLYAQYRLRLESDEAGPESGTRILHVRVLSGDSPEEIGQVEWTAVQVGEEWKIKEAPLP